MFSHGEDREIALFQSLDFLALIEQNAFVCDHIRASLQGQGFEEKTAEKEEQAKLRRNYIDAVKKNLRGQLNQINIQETDGSITNLGEKFGQKKS